MVKKRDAQGMYLYAVISGSGDRNYGPLGIDGSDVYTVSNGKVGMVVSNIPDMKLRPERRHLAAHQDVLKQLMTETTPLPISFGMIADDMKAIRKILSRHQATILEQLERVAGKVEMGLRVTWDVPNIFEYFVLTHAELRAARDHFFGMHRVPTQEEKIEVGRIFDRILKEDRDLHTEKVENVLYKRAEEIQRNPIRSEQEVMHLACLVDRLSQTHFEAAVFEAAALFDNNFAFDYNGPWAPHHFVSLDLKLRP